MNIVVLLAGGSGTRMKTDVPKQHLVVMSQQIIEYTLTAFCYNEVVDAVLVVSNKEYIAEVNELKKRFGKLRWVICGGETRILSVYNAISFLEFKCVDSDKIIFSDAVRPCITFHEVKEVVEMLEQFKGVTTGVEIYETILQTENNVLNRVIPREGVIRQTSPEGYKYNVLKQLYLDTPIEIVKQYKNIGIDQLVEKKQPIGIVKSTPLNFKITTPADLYYFDTVLKKGFDTILNGS